MTWPRRALHRGNKWTFQRWHVRRRKNELSEFNEGQTVMARRLGRRIITAALSGCSQSVMVSRDSHGSLASEGSGGWPGWSAPTVKVNAGPDRKERCWLSLQIPQLSVRHLRWASLIKHDVALTPLSSFNTRRRKTGFVQSCNQNTEWWDVVSRGVVSLWCCQERCSQLSSSLFNCVWCGKADWKICD